MGRRCCCGGGCVTRNYFGANSWTGGTVTGPATGDQFTELILNGAALPSSFVDAEAYQIEFTLKSGSVTFVIDGFNYSVGATNQTIRIWGTGFDEEIDAGYTALSPLEFQKVQIRVTPTHTYLFVAGNYEYGNYSIGATDYTLQGHAILTLDRNGSNPPTTFTANWGNATVSEFRLRSSQVEVDAYSGEESINCHVLPNGESVNPSGVGVREHWQHKPYLALKSLASDHAHYGGGSELFVPELSFVNEYYVAGSNSGTWVGDTAFVSGGSGTGGVYDGYKASNLIVGNTGDFLFNGDYCGFFSGSGPLSATRPGTFGGPSYSHKASGSVALEFPAPSFVAPYPKPVYRVNLTMGHRIGNWACSGMVGKPGFSTTGSTTETTIPVNDLQNGFVISTSATEVITACDPPSSGYRTGSASIQWTL